VPRYLDSLAGMVFETSQFFPSTITVSAYPGWALGCPTACCQPRRRNHHTRGLAMPVMGYPALNISATSGWLPSGNHLRTASTPYIPPTTAANRSALALTPTCAVFGRQVEALRSGETLPARCRPFPQRDMRDRMRSFLLVEATTTRFPFGGSESGWPVRTHQEGEISDALCRYRIPLLCKCTPHSIATGGQGSDEWRIL